MVKSRRIASDHEAADRVEPISYSVDVLAAALQIVKLFRNDRRIMSLAAIATEVGLSRSRSFRILSTLKAAGIVKQEGLRGNYALDIGAFNLGYSSICGMDITDFAKPLLLQLVNEFAAGAILGVRSGNALVDIVQVSSRSVGSTVGSTFELYSCAGGKCLLAYSPETERESLIAQQSFRPLTDRTLVTPEALRDDIAQTLKQGFALSIDETSIGFSGVSAPVFDRKGHCTATVTLLVLTVRDGAADLRTSIGPKVRAVADILTRRLGVRA